MENRTIHFILSIVLFCSTGLLIVKAISNGNNLESITYLATSIGIMSFCLGYLQPQLKKKDERITFIRQKAMYCTYIALAVYLISFMALIIFNIVAITALDTIIILIALIIATLWLSMVVLTKIH